MQIVSSRFIFSGIVLLLLLLTTGISSADEVNVDFVSHFGGEVFDVAVDGDYAYIGEGQDFVVLDITDVFNPSEVGRIITPAIVYGIVVAGNYAYVADGTNGLVVVDIGNPSALTLKGSYDTAGIAFGVNVSGNYAYVADSLDGLVIVDITDPSWPTFVGSYDTGYAHDVTVVANYAYVASSDAGLVIVDVSDPSEPTLAGCYDTEGYVYSVAVKGNYAYIADDQNGLSIVDISDPSAPTLSGSYEIGGHVVVEGNYAYVAAYDLVIVDVTNPSAPIFAGWCDTTGDAYDVAVANNYVYVADGYGGVAIIDSTEPSSPILAGNYGTSGGATDIAVSGNYAYVVDWGTCLSIMDISDPFSPILSGSYDIAGYAKAVAVEGNYAYIADEWNGLLIVDVTDLSSPTLAGSYDTAGVAYDVAAAGNYAYVADGINGLLIVDVSNPSFPKLAGSYDTAGIAFGVTVSGNHAYIADNENGFVVVDISNPSAPTLKGSYDTGFAMNVAVAGNYAYVADVENGLVIVDISDLAAPTFAGSYCGYVFGVTVSGNYAYYVADHDFVILDIGNPVSPTFMDYYGTAGCGYNLAVAGGHAYIADGDNGLVILHVEIVPDTTPPESVTNLQETGIGSNWITWTWENPYNSDFSHVMVYIDGAFVTNTSDWSYNSTGLTEGIHTISTKTVDNAGNINPTWVNDSARTATVNVEFISHIGGNAYDVALAGNHAYIGQGQDFVVLDITDVDEPSEVGRMVTSSVVTGVAVTGNYACIANDGLDVVEISDPSAPTLVGSYDIEDRIQDVAAAGNYAYVIDINSALLIVDINDPSAPTLVGSYDTDGHANTIAVWGNYVYIISNLYGNEYHGQLTIIDISNPAAPTFAGSYDTDGWAEYIAVVGNYAYITAGDLEIVDISDSAAPTLVGSCDTANWMRSVVVSGNYAYVISSIYLTDEWYDLLEIVDISNPSVPAHVGTFDMWEEYAYSIAVAGNYAYISSDYGGLVIVDISNPSTPTISANYDTVGGVVDIAISGNFAYVADSGNGLVIVDISNPLLPKIVGSHHTVYGAYDVEVAGDYAYVATHWFCNLNDLLIVDVSTPSSPALMGSWGFEEFGSDIAVAGNYVYVADGYSGLVIVDITDSSSPTTFGIYDGIIDALDVAISGNYAYVADGYSGLVILDISDPAAPTLVGSYETAYAYDVAVVGNYAYVTGGGLEIIDISDPAAPTLAGSYYIPYVCNVAVSGNYAYLAAGDLLIVDISDPSSPILAGNYNTAGYAIGVIASGDYVYVADGENGLVILRVGAPEPVDNPPVAEAGPDQVAIADSVVTFNGNASTDDKGITTYSWDFDAEDGITTEATGVTATHTYTAARNYTVTLTVTDTVGQTDSDTLQVTVSSPTTTVTYEPDYDNRLRQSSPNTVYSSTNYLDIGRLGTTSYRDVMWFDLSGYNPSDTISKATLSLYWYYPSSTRASDTVVEVYRPEQWDPQYVTWNSRMSGTPWTTPGGNWFDKNSVAQGTTPYASVTFLAGTVPDNKYYEFDVTQLVQEYVSGTTNTGFFLKAKTEGNNYIAFYSSDWPNADQRPKLTITTTSGTTPTDNPPVAEAGPEQVATTDAVVTFNGTASTDDKGIVSYSWDFDASDGITTDASGVIATTTYAIAGNYTVTLTVTDTAGQADSDTLQVVISSPTTTITLTPTYDNRLRQSSPNTVFSSTNYLDIGRLGTTSYRDVMWFDLSGYTPSDTISKATLSFYWYYPSTTRTSDTVVEVYRPLEWSPQYVTWNSRMSGTPWTTAGGNWFDKNGVAQGTTPYAAVTFPAGTVPDNQYHEFDVTQLVQEYVSGTANTGFFLKAQTEGNNYIAFYSSDWPNADQRPKLTITTTSVPVDNPPVAEAGPDQVAIADSVVTFNGNASTDDKGITTYSWDFDAEDGITTEATGVTAIHTYTAAGNYTVTLTVTDTVGQTDSDTLQVVVNSPTTTVTYTPDYDNRLRQSSPNTVYSSTNYLDIGRLGTTSYRDVMWFDLSGYTSSDMISKATLSLCWYYPSTTRTSDTVVEFYRPLEWSPQYVTWNSRMSGTPWTTAGGNWFDKNGVAQGTTPYAAVTFPAGTVPDNQYHEFDVTQLVQEYVSGTANTGFFLKAQTEGNNYIAFYSSDWPNTDQRPKLTITTTSGTPPTDNPPVAEAGSDKTATAGSDITFDGSASTDDKGIITYSWDFGDGTTSTGVTPTHAYAAAGTYTVALTVTDTVGQTDSDTLQVTVSKPTTIITLTPTYDNRLRQASPNTVYSSTNYLDIGRLGTTSYRGVMWFDLSGYTPSDTISKATLSLYWYYPPGATRTSDTIVEVYRPLEWSPQYVTWNSRMSGIPWNTPGGNWFDKNNVAQGTAPYASVTFPAGTVPDNKYYEFDVTQLVQEYVSGNTNTGFFLKAKTEGNNYIAFYSSDWPNADQRPKLNVTSS